MVPFCSYRQRVTGGDGGQWVRVWKDGMLLGGVRRMMCRGQAQMVADDDNGKVQVCHL